MSGSGTAEMISIKQCPGCRSELLERDRFCRRCGISQHLRTAPLNYATSSLEMLGCETRRLPESRTFGHSYSGVLLSAVTQGISEKASVLRADRRALRLISTLMAVPLWLMIVLLSPFDAFAAAKAITKGE